MAAGVPNAKILAFDTLNTHTHAHKKQKQKKQNKNKTNPKKKKKHKPQIPYEQIGPIVWVSISSISKVSYCRIKYMRFGLRLH